MRPDTGSRQPPWVAASFDGSRWDCFAIRPMPDRHWVVLHNRGPTIEPGLESRVTELLVGFNSYGAARAMAVALARVGFAFDACRDERRTHVPLPVPLALSLADDLAKDPDRLGPVITTTDLVG
jgi:hypothetical protein